MEKLTIGFVRYEEGYQGYRQGIAIDRHTNLRCEGYKTFEDLIDLSRFFSPSEEGGQWEDEAGNPIGLTHADLAAGICSVNIDNVTYYTTTIDNLDEDEWRALLDEYGDYRGWQRSMYAGDIVAHLEREYAITIDVARLHDTLTISELVDYLERYSPDQGEFEAEMYEEEE